MRIKKMIGLAALVVPVAAMSQSITFETNDFKAIGVYDSWEESPFRNGRQKLSGNVKVVDNQLNQADNASGVAPNATKKVLAVQRSQYGSNTFGARIDLNETFELTPQTRYVHVLINKPVEGRVMLIGLGKRRDRAGQSAETEQFQVLSSSRVSANGWSDAVFPIKGAGGIDIHSLVVVPDAESSHRLTSDFAAYIDEIQINSSATPRIATGDYVLNFDEDLVSDKANYLNSIVLTGSKDGDQTIAVGSKSPQVIYRPMLEKAFTAKPGETLTPTFNYSTKNWMNGYVYLDRGNDGVFSFDLNDDYTIAEGSDLMTYSYIETVDNESGYKSDGTPVSGNDRNFMDPPAFTVPADLANGFYRMRFKVDWGNIDPGGNVGESNHIKKNGGMIVDVRMNIHGDVCTVTQSQLNGDVVAEDGTALNNYSTPFGQPFTIKVVPAPGFTCDGIRVRHGYNLTGDSLVHGTPQYIDELYPSYLFSENKLTLPAEVMDGDVRIEAYFIEKKGSENPSEDYPVNFDRDLENSNADADRKLVRFQVRGTEGGTTTVTIPTDSKKIYRDLTSKQVSVVPGDEVTTSVTYSNGRMHSYFYIDLNQDGQFSATLDANGRPTLSGELVSYNYCNGFNSAGEELAPADVTVSSLPSFTIPESLPHGVYRARLKVDWNNADPGGNYTADGTNSIEANAGYVIDFLLNVHGKTQTLEVFTTNGSVNGASNTGLPVNLPCFTALTLVPTPAVSGYEAEYMTIKHGHNFDGPQYIHGNRQWSVFTRPATSYTLPKDSVDGDVEVSVDFVAGKDAKYRLTYSDEFDGEDYTQPDPNLWSRCKRYSSTWNRYLSDSEKVIFLRDGKLVARAIPNPDQASDPVPMITGGVESKGNIFFKYGKIEARIYTNPYKGNFPAFWLMPEDQSDGWPVCGEIDIWEQINTENKAYHTVHSNWTYNLGNKNNPKSSTNETVQMDRYHTYGFEWNETTMKWYVDGKHVATYSKLNDADALSKGQWPYDKPFYIRLNQSVGDGSWASSPDQSHTYETLFDWVRVYEYDETVGIDDIVSSDMADIDVNVAAGTISVYAGAPSRVFVSDVAGRCISDRVVTGIAKVEVPKGIYIVNGKKVLVP